MRVTNYQMHHVLDCFSRKLSKARREEKSAAAAPEAAVDCVSLSAESLRQAALEKISRRISNKLDEVRALTYRPEQPAPAARGAEMTGLAGAGETAGPRQAYRGPDDLHRQPDRPSAETGSPPQAVELAPPPPGRQTGKPEPQA